MKSSSPAASIYLVPAMLAGYLLIYSFVGERVPYNGGLGFDGYFYGHLAADFPGMLARKIPGYYLDRILPSFIVWFSAKVVGFDLSSPAAVVVAFHVYNSALLVIAAFAWVRIAQTLRLSTQVAMIGGICLFLNWNVTTQYLYFAVLTDATGFSLGVLAALCVIERRFYMLAVVAFVASFSFKLVLPLALLFVVFSVAAGDRAPLKFESRIAIGISIIAGLIALYITAFLQFQLGSGYDQVKREVLPLSIVALMVYVYAVVRNFPFDRLIPGLRFGRLSPIVFFMVLWMVREIVLALMALYFANGTDILDVKTFFFNTFATAVGKPGVFLVAHTAALGPGVILLLYFLRKSFNAAAATSIGCVLMMAATLALALYAESRILAFVYPFLVTFLCLSLEGSKISRRFVVGFAACSFVISRCYLPLNALGMQTIEPGIMTDFTQLLRFPWQWFFMNVGPYMGWAGYAINLALALVAAAVLIALLPHEAGGLKASASSMLQRRRGGGR